MQLLIRSAVAVAPDADAADIDAASTAATADAAAVVELHDRRQRQRAGREHVAMVHAHGRERIARFLLARATTFEQRVDAIAAAGAHAIRHVAVGGAERDLAVLRAAEIVGDADDLARDEALAVRRDLHVAFVALRGAVTAGAAGAGAVGGGDQPAVVRSAELAVTSAGAPAGSEQHGERGCARKLVLHRKTPRFGLTNLS